MSDFVFDVSLNDFEARVIQPSREVPVLVDFWAEWCGPCKTLKPLLEKLAAAYQGRFLLACVDADANPELCQYFGVRSIPTVALLVGGQVADGFTGARPEAEIRAFLDRHLPPPAADPRLEAASLSGANDWEGALALLQKALAASPADEDLRLDTATALLELERDDEAAALLQGEFTVAAERAKALQARLALAQGAAELAPLEAQLAANPDAHAARLALSRAYAARRRYEDAMNAALEVVRRDRSFDDDAGRRTLLDYFQALSGDDTHAALVRQYRQKLSALLH